MFSRIVSVAFVVAVIAGFAQLVRHTEKPWPLIEGQSLVHQVSACQFMNLNTSIENYMEALNVLGIRPDLATAVDLAINGPPKFGRRYDCFANLSDQEIEAVMATKEYADVQFEIYRQLDAFIAPQRGF